MSAPAIERKLSAHDLAVAIGQRYEAPEWRLESEVTLGDRRLDLVALNMWSSRAHRIVGFELKVSRGDWLRELDAFQKSEEWVAVVDAFYVVTPPKLVRDDELPAGWGLLELAGNRMMTKRHATVREGCRTIPREVAARFIGRLALSDAGAQREAEYRARRDVQAEAEARVKVMHENERENDRNELRTLRAEREELFAALNLSPRDWQAHKSALMAAGIFCAAQSDTVGLRQRLEVNAKAMEGHAARMRDALAALNQQADHSLRSLSTEGTR